uniref:SH3 domain-containing protein n=1 Tax=Timema monikensis TaxID=170555 RepID=A0A7R9EBM0_9NEOP|nr:unnamed protein product [Timema monikensis]
MHFSMVTFLILAKQFRSAPVGRTQVGSSVCRRHLKPDPLEKSGTTPTFPRRKLSPPVTPDPLRIKPGRPSGNEVKLAPLTGIIDCRGSDVPTVPAQGLLSTRYNNQSAFTSSSAPSLRHFLSDRALTWAPSTPIMPGGAPGTPSTKAKGAEYEVLDDSQEHWWKVKDEQGALGVQSLKYSGLQLLSAIPTIVL